MTVFQLICCYFDFGLIGRYGQFYPIVDGEEGGTGERRDEKNERIKKLFKKIKNYHKRRLSPTGKKSYSLDDDDNCYQFYAGRSS